MKGSVGLSFLLFLVIILGCEGQPEFTQLASGLSFRYVDQQEGNKPRVGDIMKVQMSHFLGDSLIFETKEGGIFINPITGAPPNLSEALKMCGTGDSVQIQMSLGKYGRMIQMPMSPKMDTSQIVTWNMRVDEVDNESTILARMRSEQLEKDEELIQEYIVNNNLETTRTDEGLHYVTLQEGNGQFPKLGDKVSVNYTLTRLDGTVLDTSREDVARANNQYSDRRTYVPYEFEIGTQGIIEGWNLGVPKFSKGGRGKLIVPSVFGYGVQGKGAEVPPNTVLVFDIELVDIK
ncbi:FKBP-type peptidyl-prolyl cis-trans isomerase [Roseivirga sp.]|uniref:FKBP-type peptidyl-prolyl cis-trans isomerase n=1 Tax=Roseivirga sp. TaxID=1964215 RepID=UPI003B8DD9B5